MIDRDRLSYELSRDWPGSLVLAAAFEILARFAFGASPGVAFVGAVGGSLASRVFQALRAPPAA
jgi:hypothetical protein